MKTAIAIIMTNVSSGGTPRHAFEMAAEWSRQGQGVIFVQTINRLVKVYFYDQGQVDYIIRFWDKDGSRLMGLMRKCQVRLIHVEHLLDAEPCILNVIKNLHVPLVVTLHDYYFICPFIKLTNEDDIYCGEKGVQICNECLSRRGFYSVTLGKAIQDIKAWRKFWGDFLKEVSLIIVPSADMEKRVKGYFPLSSIQMRENPELIFSELREIQVGLIGSLSVAKGAKVIKDILALVSQKKSPIHFTLFGTLPDVQLTKEENQYITILGPYKEQDIYQIIASHSVNYFWFPGVCPETYSYTLTIPIRLRIPCLSSDIGAIASRIHSHHWGETYPWDGDVDEILEKLLSFDYRQFYNSDFVIENTSFGTFEKFYTGISYKETQDRKQVVHEVDSPIETLPKVLTRAEFNELWIGAGINEKRKILVHVDKKWLLSVWQEKGCAYFLKKLKAKIMK